MKLLHLHRRHHRLEAAEGPVSIRPASTRDADALERLAQLDSVRVPREPLLLVEVGDELRAVLSLSDGRVLADPFHTTGPLVELLKEHAAALSG